jgi:hypothetical protein
MSDTERPVAATTRSPPGITGRCHGRFESVASGVIGWCEMLAEWLHDRRGR